MIEKISMIGYFLLKQGTPNTEINYSYISKRFTF